MRSEVMESVSMNSVGKKGDVMGSEEVHPPPMILGHVGFRV